MKILLQGASGRMGTEIRRLAESRGHGVLALPREGNSFPVCDVLIDFSTREGTVAAALKAFALRIPLVSGTTALGEEALNTLRMVAEAVPVVHANNFSPGMALFRRAVQDFARNLPKNFAVEVVETHHRHKRDAPSGTARDLAHLIREERRKVLEDEEFTVVPHSLRGGEVFGEHTVHFLGDGEVLRIFHGALRRSVFAAGALAVAEFLVEATPAAGRLYTFEDVLPHLRMGSAEGVSGIDGSKNP
jgi:4-hydroxy-tetrahydrodipicolinate reductase